MWCCCYFGIWTDQTKHLTNQTKPTTKCWNLLTMENALEQWKIQFEIEKIIQRRQNISAALRCYVCMCVCAKSLIVNLIVKINERYEETVRRDWALRPHKPIVWMLWGDILIYTYRLSNITKRLHHRIAMCTYQPYTLSLRFPYMWFCNLAIKCFGFIKFIEIVIISMCTRIHKMYQRTVSTN